MSADGITRLDLPGPPIEVRPGTAADVPLLAAFIGSMAEYEKLTAAATEEGLRESLFGEHPAARTLLAFEGGRPVAYVVYFFTFSTMLGRRGLWLEDLFVIPERRGRGIGKALMERLARTAVENRCGRFEWAVLGWNEPAIGFYRRLGASFLDDWRVCRLEGEAIGALAERRG